MEVEAVMRGESGQSVGKKSFLFQRGTVKLFKRGCRSNFACGRGPRGEVSYLKGASLRLYPMPSTVQMANPRGGPENIWGEGRFSS